MATAKPIRSQSRVSNDRSGSCSDDVVSLDSWSEKLETVSEWSNTMSDVNCARMSSGRGGRSNGCHQKAGPRTPFWTASPEKSVNLRSESRIPTPAEKSGIETIQSESIQTIATISGTLECQDCNVLPAANQSTSDSDSVPLRARRLCSQDQSCQTSRIPSPLTQITGEHCYPCAHYLPVPPHYQSPPTHCSSVGHPTGLYSYDKRHSTILQFGSYWPQNQDRTHCHHGDGACRCSLGQLQQTTCQAGSNGALDQLLEREGEKIKTKMKSMWNNVKYGWTIKTKTSFKYDSPIFLLGRCYHRRIDVGEEGQDRQQRYKVSALHEFQADFTSRLWFTYRREFSPIGSGKMTSDCGWGCMLRSGQMMMAQGLVQHFLQRDWKVYSEQCCENLAFYRDIIRWFGDQPSDKVPFSLHHLVELGTSVGKMPGDWYGPASVAHIFRNALDKAHISLPVLSNICLYVAQDCTIYLDDLRKILSSDHRRRQQSSDSDISDSDVLQNSASNHLHDEQQTENQPHVQRSKGSVQEKFRSVIILVPMRLGGETLNEIYIPCVKAMLAHEHCIGIIGGRPKHSLYFVGWQDDKLIYLDPHYCQDTVDTSLPDYPIQSFHCMSPRKMPFSKMDPSCTVGFYCRDEQDLRSFIQQVPEMVVPPCQRGHYPLFVVSEGCSNESHSQQPPVRELGRLRIRHMRTDYTGKRIHSPTVESEDFVIL